MKAHLRSKGIVCCTALALLAGSQAVSHAEWFSVTPLVLTENEQIVRDRLIILVDVTGSMGSTSKFDYEKALVQAFTGTMPDGPYESGIDSFAGVTHSEWLQQPLAPFSHDVMVRAASRVEPLGSLTPLSRAIRNQKAEVAGKMDRGALLVFSDGKVRDPEDVLQACRDLKTAHGGEFCIFTVQAGSSERGRKVLQEMAAVNGCGKYYDGASLDSAAAIEGVVRDILIGAREVPKPAPQVAKAAPMPWKLNTILFDNDCSVIAPMYEGMLDEAAAMLRDNPNTRIHLAGHTDSNASTPYNQKLSERRTEAVRVALAERNADALRLDTESYGETQPAVPNDSPDNLHKNRRVELSVTE